MANASTARDVPVRNRIAKRLLNRRIELNLSVEAVAHAAHVRRYTIYRYEQGKASIPAELLPKIANAVKMPVLDLLLGKAA